MSKSVRQVTIDNWVDRDLTLDVGANRLVPAFAVEDVVHQAEDVLHATGQRSPVIVGARGVGKTAVIHELIRRAHAGAGVAYLTEGRIIQISLRTISARFKEKADATNFFGDLVQSIVSSPEPLIPFIRDLHLAYVLDWESMIQQLVANLGRPLLAEGLPREVDHVLEFWSDLTDYLVPIPLQEPTQRQMRSLLRQWSDWFATAQGTPIEPDAQRSALELTARFMGDRPFPRKTIELLRQTADFLGHEGPTSQPVGVRDVVRRFSQMTRVPHRLVDPDEELDLSEVRRFVSERLLGQEEAVDAVVRMIALIKAGLADLRRPFGTFLFVGPTGVGKTWCAQLLAEYLFGDPHRLVRINMAEYAEAHHALTVFGHPHAAGVNDQRGVLSQRLQGNPFGVLLLDEFEKAHAKVHDGFLQLFDEGRFINGRSETVSVTSMIIIATSNAGAEVYREAGLGFDRGASVRDLDQELDRRLHRRFRFELLNRFDRVVHFHPLDRASIRQIAKRELAELCDRDGLVGRGLDVEVDAEVLDWLVAHGYHPHWGARFLRREIERHIAGTLAEYVVSELPVRGTRLAVGVRQSRIAARTVESPHVETPSPVPLPNLDLDLPSLLDEARSWIERFAPLIHEFNSRQGEASALIEASAQPGFWSEPGSEAILERYKSLDARLQADRRLLKPVRRLTRVLAEEEGYAEVGDLRRLIEQAARSYWRLLDLGTGETEGAAWLVLGPADSVVENAGWLTDLLAMYRGWFRRKGLMFELIAEEVDRGQARRLVMEVEGAGVLKLLEMERGEHRRQGTNGKVQRALVEVIPRQPSRSGPDGGPIVEDAGPTQGFVINRRVAQVEVEVPERGFTVRLYGNAKERLSQLARDLGDAMAHPPEPFHIARSYAERGTLVQDPRTHASSTNLKDVLRGNLEPFLQAWEVR